MTGPLSEFFAMGGYAFYVWASYGAAAIALGVLAYISYRRDRVTAARLETLRQNAPHRRRAATPQGSDHGA